MPLCNHSEHRDCSRSTHMRQMVSVRALSGFTSVDRVEAILLPNLRTARAPLPESSPPSSDPHRRNRLLAALPSEVLDFLRPKLTVMPLDQGEMLLGPDEATTEAVFPHDCILSVMTVMEDGRSAETTTIGAEGCFGFASGPGDRRAINRCVVQIPGSASRLPLEWLDEAARRYPAVHDLQLRYLKALLTQTQRSVACSSLHTVDLRCCRKLLRIHDWVERDTFPLKQDYLAQTLGVRRATVSQVCAALQDAGIIRYSRGSVTVLDRSRLEAAACECYGAIRQTYERLLPRTSNG